MRRVAALAIYLGSFLAFCPFGTVQLNPPSVCSPFCPYLNFSGVGFTRGGVRSWRWRLRLTGDVPTYRAPGFWPGGSLLPKDTRLAARLGAAPSEEAGGGGEPAHADLSVHHQHSPTRHIRIQLSAGSHKYISTYSAVDTGTCGTYRNYVYFEGGARRAYAPPGKRLYGALKKASNGLLGPRSLSH